MRAAAIGPSLHFPQSGNSRSADQSWPPLIARSAAAEISNWGALPFLLDHVEETWRVFGKHYWEYGIAPNRPAFEAMGRYLFEQGLASRVVTPEEMFVACE